MIQHDTMLHKIKGENQLLGKEKYINEVSENSVDVIGVAKNNTLLDYEEVSDEAEADVERFWNNGQFSEVYDRLLDNAHRYDLSNTYNEQAIAERENKQKVREELAQMSRISDVRSADKRLDHMNKAKKNYLKAAASVRKLIDKRRRGGAAYVSYGEEAISQMMDAEIELIKAEGLKDKAENYRIARLELKKKMMIQSFYSKVINDTASENVKEKYRDKSKRLSDAVGAFENEKEQIFVDQAISWRVADIFGGNNVMSYEQFEKFITKTNGSFPEKLAEMKTYFEGYKNNVEMVEKDELHSDVIQTGSLNALIQRCIEYKKVFKKNKNIKKALDVLHTQCNRKHQSLMHRQYAEGNEVRKNVVKEDDYSNDFDRDEFISYAHMTNKEYVRQVLKNEYNYDFSKKSLYGTRINDLKYGSEKIVCNEDSGYIAHPDSKYINELLRFGPEETRKRYYADSLNEYRRTNAKKNRVPYQSVSKEEAKKILGEDAELVDEWEERINKLIKLSPGTISKLSDATKQNRLAENSRFYRMVGSGFLSGALKIDTKKKVSEQVEAINRMAGTVYQEKGFMSTGFKADAIFFDEDKDPGIMLTVLADKGQKCFVTANSVEGEVIFDKGTKLVIIGAYARGQKGKSIPVTTYGDPFSRQKLENARPRNGKEPDENAIHTLENHSTINGTTGVFRGIEIIAKIVKE